MNKINLYSYSEYVNDEVSESSKYLSANKNLSLAYYIGENIKCLAFASLRRQCCPQLGLGKNGLRIIDYYTLKDFQNIYRIEDMLLNEMIRRVCNRYRRNGSRTFDYVWFTDEPIFNSIHPHIMEIKRIGRFYYFQLSLV